MTRKIGRLVIIEPEPPRVCQYCFEKKECRPYGHDGADICWECSESTDELKTLKANALKILFNG